MNYIFSYNCSATFRRAQALAKANSARLTSRPSSFLARRSSARCNALRARSTSISLSNSAVYFALSNSDVYSALSNNLY